MWLITISFNFSLLVMFSSISDASVLSAIILVLFKFDFVKLVVK